MLLLQLYKWSNGRFTEYGSGLDVRGASGLALFTINTREFLAISSYYDSVSHDYESKSVIFEWRNNRFVRLREITTNGATGVEYFMLGGVHFFLFVNSRTSPALYNAETFVLHQDVPIVNATSMKEFSINGEGTLKKYVVRQFLVRRRYDWLFSPYSS